MIPRYTNPEMGRIWSDQRKYETWLRVEVAAAEAMAATGLVPEAAARDIAACPGVRAERVDEIERTTQHDVIAFTTAVAEQVGPSARWLHFGLTSSDVLDTALALQMREACGLILAGLDGATAAVAERAREHRDTPMIGRTHGVHAEPMTFGLKLALWHAELGRARTRVARAREVVSVGKISGAVGTYAHLEPEIERRVCAALGLTPAPVASQIVQRDRHAELLGALAITGASIEKFAVEVRGLQKTEIGEVEEGFAKGQKGSSAMPHKRNPIGCEQLTGLARVLRAQRHGRPRERGPVARARHLALVGGARRHPRQLHRARPHAAAVRPHRARRWWCIPGGCARIWSARAASSSRAPVLLELAQRGVSREQAYAWVPAGGDAVARRAARLQGRSGRGPGGDGGAVGRRPRRGVRPRAAVASRRPHRRPRAGRRGTGGRRKRDSEDPGAETGIREPGGRRRIGRAGRF